MKMLDVIEYFDESGEEIVHRIPESGSAETRVGSQLVVRENQAAVFFRDGKALDILGAGRHTLSTLNVPLLAKLIGVPFDNKSPFRIEIYFINMKVYTNLKWGTKEPVPFRDSELGMVRLRAFGAYTMRVADPLLLINDLVGTRGAYSSLDVDNYLKDVIVSRLNDILGENVDTIFNLAALYDELGVASKSRLRDDFSKYGLELLDFFINAITPPAEVQKMIDERAGMGAVGDMGRFMQFKAAKAMEKAAEGTGGGAGGEGGTAGAGMGLGVGAGMGMMIPGMVMGAMQQGAQGQAAPLVICPHCKGQAPANSKFCPSCGKPLTENCPSCSQPVPGGSKFCPNCGKPLSGQDPAETAPPENCPSCNAPLDKGSKFCFNCGHKF
ncbi:MAG: SPFH domain-containing protein [Candidatus Alcyoniella australis]|nr:SPFH domain-containing protein [Candidatus Alcyoniella australis]